MAKSTFSLNTVVSRFWMSNIEAQLQVNERYSHEQKRARIEYDNGGVSAEGRRKKSVYYDVNQKVMVTLESRSTVHLCSALGVNPRLTDLQNSEVQMHFGLYMFERLLIMDGEADDWQHIVGPARLLIWIEQNFQKFKRSDKTSQLDNIPIEVFSYDTSLEESLKVGAPFHMDLGYKIGESRGNIRIPSVVIITAEQSSYGFTYEFSLENLQTHPSQTSVSAHEANGDTIQDEYTFPINFGCSQQLNKVNRIFKSDDRLDRVSFRASVRSKFERPQQYTKTICKDQVVSYYQPLEAIRIETMHKDTTKSIELINFKIQTHFHIRLDRQAATRSGSVDLGYKPQSCIAMRSTPCDLSKNDKDVEDFLLGPNEYALMGRGTVRGIDVLIYETTGGQLPYWIERATNCVDLRNGKYTQTSDERVNIVIYVADSANQDRRYLVQMDVFRGSSRNRVGPLHRSIQFYDFVWSFKNRVAADLFSLQDHCFSTGESGAEDVVGTATTQSVFVVDKVDRVDMLLASATDTAPGSYEWLRDSMRRNLALRVAMQNDLDLPATSVTDLQSGLMIQERSDSSTASIHVSFRQLCQARPMVLKPTFLGTLTVKAIDEDGSILIGDSMSFQECLFEVGHRELLQRADTRQFNYDSRTGRCWIRHAPLGSDLIGSSNRVDVFSLQFEVKDSKELSWTHGTERLNSLDKRIKLINEKNPKDMSLFHLKDVNANKDDDFRAINSGFRVNVDSFRGFGLTMLDRRNWRIRPQKVFTNEDAIPLTMSTATCKQACLLDPRCKSYSLCIDPRSELACTLSEANFRSRRVVEQLSVSSARRNSNYGSLTIYLDSIDTIELTKSSRCELHNKLYSQLFERGYEVRTESTGKRVYGVDSREDCAQICLNRTNKILSESDYGNGSEISLRKLVQKRRDICAHFYYIDRIELEALSDEIKNSFNTSLEKPETESENYEGVNGYCMINAGRTTSPRQTTRAPVRKGSYSDSGASFEYFVFDFETLFDKSHGVSLKAATFNQRQLEAYTLLTQTRDVDGLSRDPNKHELYKDAVGLMDSFLDQGNNIQSSGVHIAHIRRCAKKCIYAEAGIVWPICKSFDIKVVKDHDSGENHLVCYLNSMTLSEIKRAKRFDLIDTNRNQSREMWHYEPLLSTMRLLTGSQRDEFDANEVVLNDEFESSTRLRQQDSGSVFGEFCLTALGIISGLILGIKLATHNKNKYPHGVEDRIQFAQRRATVEFVNQVNSEGKIPTR